jgi:hypothetical protein
MSNSKRDYLTFFGQYVAMIDSRWKDLAKMLSFVHDALGVIQKFPFVVRQYYLDALLSFLTFNFFASILASSESVEAAINRDTRMRFDPIKEWPMLTSKTLNIAKAQGPPVEKLLIDTDNSEEGRIDFLTFRQKFGHGDIHITSLIKGRLLLLETAERRGGLQVNLRETPGRLRIALQQLKLAHGFLSALYKDSEPEGLVMIDMRRKEPDSSQLGKGPREGKGYLGESSRKS